MTRQNFVESLDIFDFVWIPTLNGIALLFGLGIAFDSVASLCANLHLRRKQDVALLILRAENSRSLRPVSSGLRLRLFC